MQKDSQICNADPCKDLGNIEKSRAGYTFIGFYYRSIAKIKRALHSFSWIITGYAPTQSYPREEKRSDCKIFVCHMCKRLRT